MTNQNRSGAAKSGVPELRLAIFPPRASASLAGLTLRLALLLAALTFAGDHANAATKLSNFKPNCYCESLRSMLAPEDVTEIEALPAQVTLTLDRIKDTPMAPDDAGAKAVAQRIEHGNFDGRFERVKAGTHACTVYWYGFIDLETRVSKQTCAVTRDGDAISVATTTGDGFATKLVPYVPGAEAFIGRTFLPGHKIHTYVKELPANPEDDHFGNIVGLALANKGDLTLITINGRSIGGANPIYFAVIEVE